jgi:hypothetical protein
VSDRETTTAPVVVLTYQFGGSARLRRMLEDQPELAVTSATGLIGACNQAAYAWRQVEERPAAPLSDLAAKSIRTMITGAITIITARAGRPRWCEIAPADRSAVEAFLTLFPGCRFICLHRACEDVVYATVRASRWGILGQDYASYLAALPSGGQVPAVAAWWIDHTNDPFTFEEDHPGLCERVRYEDIISDSFRNGVADPGVPRPRRQFRQPSQASRREFGARPARGRDAGLRRGYPDRADTSGDPRADQRTEQQARIRATGTS